MLLIETFDVLFITYALVCGLQHFASFYFDIYRIVVRSSYWVYYLVAFGVDVLCPEVIYVASDDFIVKFLFSSVVTCIATVYQL